MKQKTNRFEGIIEISAKGTGYVQIDGFKEDIEIDFKHLNTALNGDLVEIVLFPKSKNRQSGEVSKIKNRLKKNFVGILEKEKDLFFVKPDDMKMYTDILINKDMLCGAQIGEKVYTEITSWKDSRKSPEGKILKILGMPGDNDTEMHSIAIEKGFDSDLADTTHEEAKLIKEKGIVEDDSKKRKDFRDILTFTIDPYDAKDFDDALSFRELPNGNYEIGIHIADVSHYVTTGTALDKEASGRGTSVYLVDRTIPMLPEILSNDLCSLVPNKDRLTMSAVFEINKNAEIKNEWFGKTIIHSKKRFSYEEAEKTIKNTQSELHKELNILNNLAKKLTNERIKNGAISLEQEEVKFVLDGKGTPIEIKKKERGDSNKLIEEFMLLANKKVAELMFKVSKKDGVFIYRIHDLPSKEKMDELVLFLRSIGHKVILKNGIIPQYEINNILKRIEKKKEKDTIQRAIIRSMAKAIYSTRNIGHYGLAFKYYTHFTSPIRRYPDIMVHRFLDNFLNGTMIKNTKLKDFEKIARISSEQEKRASDAERSSIKYKQVEYMSKRVMQNFRGIITGITEWGIYVEEIETKCEGLIRIRDMKDDFYVFNEKKFELSGTKYKKKYHLGDVLKIKVNSVNLEKKTIDYILG